jgi:pyrroline-5-carboxylate reductase
MNIAIIGGGNLGTAIATGLVASKFAKGSDITVTKRNLATIEYLKKAGIKISNDNQKSIQKADIIILAVKPFQIKDVLESIHLSENQIVVSTVTGVYLRDLKQWTGNKIKVFRAMPNTAIAIRKSVTCISHEETDEKSIELIKKVFDQLGASIIIEEKLMNAATVIGACGIAFAMRYIRASIQGGIQIGFSAEQARFIVSETVNGAAELLLQNHSHPEQEIDKVTTPQGCTISGLNELEHRGFSSAVIKGVTASYDKIG